VLAVCCMIFLLIIKYWMKGSIPIPGQKYAKFIPSALILVVISTAISASGKESTGFEVVGRLPNGLPKPLNFFTLLDDGDFWHLCMPAFLITILSFIESIAVAQKFADKHGYAIDASQELLALGFCNLIGCWFQIYPVSGVLSLATVVEAAGATTPLYGIMAGSGLIVCCAALLFLFEWLPKPVLGAIVFVGIMGLIDTHKMKKIYKLNKRDFIVTAVTILVTLFLGIDFGVALGVVASIVLFIQKSAKPHYSILGKMNLSGDKAPVYRNVKMYPSATKRPDMLMIRWDAPIFFANTASFKSRIRKHIGRFLEENNYPNQWCLVLCFSGVNDVDFTGIEHLEQFLEELKEKEVGMTLVLTKVKVQVLNQLTIGEICGDGHIVPKDPSRAPTTRPSNDPSRSPTPAPTHNPTAFPTPSPTENPTPAPTDYPTPSPTDTPTQTPTRSTLNPSVSPTLSPTTASPTQYPTESPVPSGYQWTNTMEMVHSLMMRLNCFRMMAQIKAEYTDLRLRILQILLLMMVN